MNTQQQHFISVTLTKDFSSLGLGILTLGAQLHFISAVVKILAVHPDVRVLVQSVDF